jgi:hypothetical protein
MSRLEAKSDVFDCNAAFCNRKRKYSRLEQISRGAFVNFKMEVDACLVKRVKSR